MIIVVHTFTFTCWSDLLYYILAILYLKLIMVTVVMTAVYTLLYKMISV